MNMRPFGFLALQEFASGGEVVEEIPNLHRCAGGTAGGAHLDDPPAMDGDLRGLDRVVRPLRVVRARRLTLAMLGRASPRKPIVVMASRSSARRILLVAWRSKQSRASSRLMPMPSSVTRIRLRPPAWTSTLDARGLGVEGVFDQFFHDAGGAFDDLAGGDLIRHLLRQQADAIHAGESIAAPPNEQSTEAFAFSSGLATCLILPSEFGQGAV